MTSNAQVNQIERTIPVVDFGKFMQEMVKGNYSLSKIHLAVHHIFLHMNASQKDIYYIAPHALGNTFKLLENCIITKPEWVHKVLHEYESSHHLHKAAAAQAFLKDWALGMAGIPIIPTDDKHAFLRELIAPYFLQSRIDTYKPSLIRLVDNMIERWNGYAEGGEVVNIYPELQDITRNFIIDSIAQAHDFSEEEMRVATRFLDKVIGYFVWRTVFADYLVSDEHIPGYNEVRELSDDLNEVVFRLIDRYETLVANDEAPDDLLSHMVKTAKDDERLTRQMIRDVIIALFLAGYETTAKTLSSGLFEMARQPEKIKKLQAELDAYAQDHDLRDLKTRDINRINYLKAAANETLRLWSAPWAIQRTSFDDDMIFEDEDNGYYRIPAGTQVIISTWTLHRDARFFDEPETFSPERWLESHPSRNAVYLPFSQGKRDCVGSGIAWLEINYIMARLFQKFDFEIENPDDIDFVISASTIGPTNLPVRFKHRK